MKSFEDIIIFMHDVERCLGRLDEEQQQFIARMTLQEYTVLEVSKMMHLSPKTVVSRYKEAIDRLTRIFLSVEILEVKKLVKRGTEAPVLQVAQSRSFISRK
jgi:DNA-directed RNA polymerase specialized sigma24 family protein